MRLEAAGYTDIKVASMLKMLPAGLATLKQDPDYGLVRERILRQVITELDTELSDDREMFRAKLKSFVPLALDNLLLALKDKDPKVYLRASEQVLNRDGNLAEVSRIGLPTEGQGGFASTKIDDEVATDLIKAFGAAHGKTPPDTTIQ